MYIEANQNFCLYCKGILDSSREKESKSHSHCWKEVSRYYKENPSKSMVEVSFYYANGDFYSQVVKKMLDHLFQQNLVFQFVKHNGYLSFQPIEINQNPQLLGHIGILSVPTILINKQCILDGTIVSELLSLADMFDILFHKTTSVEIEQQELFVFIFNRLLHVLSEYNILPV